MSRARALLIAGMCAASACAREPHALDWEIAFATSALRMRAAVIEARIAKGGCKSEDFVYLSHFDPEKPGTIPPELDKGRYGFVARAQDRGCRWFAYGCTEANLPDGAGKPVAVRMAALSDEALDCDAPLCRSLNCGSTPSDIGGPAEAPNDAAIGEDVDAGGADDDAGVPGTRPPPDAGLPTLMLAFEAESADPLRAPFLRLDDAMASGGAYIVYPNDPMQTLEQQQSLKRATPPKPDADGIAVYHFNVPRAGSYRLWGRAIMHSIDEDSFWVKVDDGSFLQWNDVSHGDNWRWVDMRNFELRSEPYAFTLAKGQHTLLISYREVGTLLDKLLFVSDLHYVPPD